MSDQAARVFLVAADMHSQEMADEYGETPHGMFNVMLCTTANGDGIGFPMGVPKSGVQAYQVALQALEALSGNDLPEAVFTHCGRSCWVLRYHATSQRECCFYVLWVPSISVITNPDFIGGASGGWFNCDDITQCGGSLSDRRWADGCAPVTAETMFFFEALRGHMLIQKRVLSGTSGSEL